MSTSVAPEEVQLLVSPQTMAPGNRMRKNVLSFEALSSTSQLIQRCETAYFQYRVTAGKKYKIRPDGDDGWRTITPLCRKYTFPRSFPESQAVAAILEGTIIGPVLEVRIVKFLIEHGIEIAIQSFARLAKTSHVVISRETERFVNEIHDHKEELRSSNELLTAFQKSERRKPCGEERGSKETCANPRSNPRKRSFLQVKENGLRLTPTLHQGKICLHRYPR